MGRGNSYGGGQSSLNYLFGGGEAPKPAVNNAPANTNAPAAAPAPAPASIQPADSNNNKTSGANRSSTNNYFRADGQNTGNFITDRPSTKVQAAPGGGSSLDYLFGGVKK